MAFSYPHYQQLSRSKVIDGFRTIGILMIVWYHLWLQSWKSSDLILFGHSIHLDLIPSVGYLGVDILLFITGFGLFFPYVQANLTNTPLPTIKHYISHRILRIIPSYYLALMAGFLFFTVERGTFSTNPLWHLLTHLTFIHTLFPETNASISTVFWTIGTEVQFYLIFPLLAWLAIKKPWLTLPAMVIVAYIFRLFNLTHNSYNIEFLLRQMPAFLDIYACGMLTAFILSKLQIKISYTQAKGLIATIISVCLLIAFILTLQNLGNAALKDNGRFVWLTFYRLWLGLLLSSLIISISFSFKFFQWIFTNKLVLFISLISYNLYLWHYLILLELKAKNFPPAATSNQLADLNWRTLYFWIAFATCLAVATLVTFAFERPLIKLFKKISEKKITI